MSQEQLEFIHSFVPPQESPFTLLLLHGTGGNENSMVQIGRSMASKAALLSPRGKVLENGMPRFFRRFDEGVFDLEDLRFRTHELADFVEAASEFYHFDLSKIIAVGFSNGANIAASTLLLRPGLLAGAILFRAMVPLVPEEMPDLSGTSVFISAGRLDPITPQEQPERLASLLSSTGVDVILNWENTGHKLNLQEMDKAKEWLSGLMIRS
ncbi:MAG TPA: alpha/beta hydrolase [Thermodesulfobacteriota bacterium]|nr:alpha/beta hydrolase [Thermodesulfobacteriota bacterium]